MAEMEGEGQKTRIKPKVEEEKDKKEFCVHGMVKKKQ
jgi:hypothetical protein